MRAYLASPDTELPTLTDRPVPSPDADEVLVRVRTAALNNGDLARAAAERIAGYEFAGVVEEVGAGVDASLVGTRVAGIAGGAFAERVVAHASHLLALPEGLGEVEATTLPTGLMTELGAMLRSGLTGGETVLITAASSGIGLLGIQVAHELGASTVIATTRRETNRALLDAAGADHVVVGDADAVTEAVLDLTDGTGADIVLDHIGGPALADAIQAARQDGMVVSVGRLGGGEATIDLFALARRRVTLRSVSFGPTPPEVIGDLMVEVQSRLIPAVVEGRIKPVVDEVLPFDDLDAAVTRLREHPGHGKVVLRVSE